jgi:hypothetical protein
MTEAQSFENGIIKRSQRQKRHKDLQEWQMGPYNRLLPTLASIATSLVLASFATAADTVPANLDFERGKPGEAPVRWFVPKVPGYRVGISDEDPKSGKQCVLIERDAEEAGHFGNVMQRIDAGPFRGKRVRYRAAVRAEVDGKGNEAHLWLRVDRPEIDGLRTVGFFDNMHNRPITKETWDYYEIVGDIEKDAESINLGMFLLGRGRAWVDDVSLEVVDQEVPVTGRTLGRMSGTSLSQLGPGLFEVTGAMELEYRPSLLSRLATTLRSPQEDSEDEQGRRATLLIPLPLAYQQQVPVTYELTVRPSEAAGSVEVYRDTLHNHVVRLAILLTDKQNKADIQFRSVVLVGPSSFRNAPRRATVPGQWPEECQPWLASTWCVDWKDERIQALATEILGDSEDVMTIISGVQVRAAAVFQAAQGHVQNLTAVEALVKQGSCTSCANLVAALLRACNIPARVLAGYPSWTGPLQTHYIVEAYVPEFGWYPIESTRCESPWPNTHQINVAIIPPEHESEKLAQRRPWVAGGVPFLSLTEVPDAPDGILLRGTVDRGRFCDHQCKLLRKFSDSAGQWEPALEAANPRWRQWLASNPQWTKKGQLVFGPKVDEIEATSPSELIDELTH